MKNDDIEGKALANIMQLDMFFSGPDYMKLIETSQSGTTHAKVKTPLRYQAIPKTS
jgi:hypothetical protein